MKRLKLILLFLLLVSLKGFPQGGIRGIKNIEKNDWLSDSINLSPNKDFEKRIKLNPIEESQNDIEIRFYELEELSNTRNLKILVLKNEIWKGKQFSESNYPKIKIKKFVLEAPKGIEEVVKTLFKNNLIGLLSQDELKPKMKKYGLVDSKRGRSEQVIFVNDGYSYSIEFKIGDKYRIYTFNNPETYAEFYNDVHELKNYVVIKNIFNSELKKK